MQKIDFGIKVFGGETSKNSPNEIIKILHQNIDNFIDTALDYIDHPKIYSIKDN